MKKLIFGLAFIYCILCRAYNVEERDTVQCDVKETPAGASDCVDRNLNAGDDNKSIYYDKCCFFRYREKGEMQSKCKGVDREKFMDIPEYIERLEKLNPDMKVYELDCNSSYLKLFAFGFILFNLLF